MTKIFQTIWKAIQAFFMIVVVLGGIVFFLEAIGVIDIPIIDIKYIGFPQGGLFDPKDAIGKIFTIIIIMLAFITLAGIVSWQQIIERKKELEDDFGTFKQKLEAEVNKAKKVTGEIYLSLAGQYLSQAQRHLLDESKVTFLICLERAQHFAKRFQMEHPEDFRGPRLNGHIKLLNGKYEEAVKHFEIAKQKIDKKDPEYSSLIYSIAVVYLIFYKYTKNGSKARLITDLLIEAFKGDSLLIDYAIVDDQFTSPANSERWNPFVEELKALKEKENIEAKDIVDLLIKAVEQKIIIINDAVDEKDDENPLVEKLKDLKEQDKGIEDLQKDKNEIENWVSSLRNFLINKGESKNN